MTREPTSTPPAHSPPCYGAPDAAYPLPWSYVEE
jgi:hypothetical protein